MDFRQMDFVDVNEAGLCALDARRYKRAVNLFRYAVSKLNEEREETPRPIHHHHRHHRHHHRQHHGRGNNSALVVDRSPFFRTMPIMLELFDESFIDQTCSPDGHFALYDTAFLIDYHDIWKAYPFAIPTLLYNMALTLHVQALETPNHVKLDQARQIYEKALNFLVQSKKATLAATREGERRVLFFALCNNYGHCCSILCDYNGVRKAQSFLCMLLSDPWSAMVLTPAELSFFRMTCLVGILRETVFCTSPAA